MPQLLYPTAAKVEGPILLSLEQLRELDSILDKHEQLLTKYQEEIWERELSERLSQQAEDIRRELTEEEKKQYTERFERRELDYRRRQRQRKTTVYFRSRRRLEVATFQEAAKHPEMMNDLPVGFDLRVRYSPVRLWIETDDYLGSTIKVSAEPESDENARDLFGELRMWLSSVTPPRWQQWWVKSRPLNWMLWWLWLVVVVLVAGPNIVESEVTKRYYRAQAHGLIEKGITPENQQKAIEVILALSSDYSTPKAPPVSVGSWFWFFLTGGLFICAVLSFPPKVILGLGKGEKSIQFWRYWLRFVFVGVPTFVASNFLWPTLASLVQKLLSR